MPRASRSRSRGRSASRSPRRSRSRSRGRRPSGRSDSKDLRGRSRDRRAATGSPPRGERRGRRRSVSSSSSGSSSSGSSRSRSRSVSRSPPRRGRRDDRRSRRRSNSHSSNGSKSRSRSWTPEHTGKKVIKRERSVSDTADQRDSKRRQVEVKDEETKTVSPSKQTESNRVEKTAIKEDVKSPKQSPKRDAATPERSPPRRKKSDEGTPPRRAKRDAMPERTPPRRAKRDPTPDRTPPHRSKRGSSRSAERSPPRRSKRESTSDRTPPRRSKKESTAADDATPPPRSRRSKRDASKNRERTPPRRSKREDKRRSATPERSVRKRDDRRDKSPPSATPEPAKPKPNILLNDVIKGRTGGVYIPPFKLAQMRKDEKEDPNSETFQRQSWEALRKSINGLINKVNVSNISNLIPELFQENLVRGRGLLARSIMKAQLASPGFTHIYAALLAVINTKLPESGELVLKRVVFRFRRAFKRGDKVVAIALVRFIAHLVNQQIVHELLALEVLTLLLANPTDDSVEVAVNFTKECGQILAELCPEGLRAIFERFRGILHEGEIDKRVQYTIEGLFAIRKGGFADYPAVHEQLDLVESGDQITHEITLEEDVNREDQLDVFRFDPEFEKNETMWSAIKKEILGESDSDSDGSSDGSGSESDDEEEGEDPSQMNSNNNNNNHAPIQDMTEQDLVNLRRTIYLTIMSSISHEECAHKLLKLNIRAGQEKEICNMLLECCSQERTYLRYFGLLGQRFCMIKREYQDAFDECFAEQYSLIHRLETNKLRNVAKFFAHLLFTDALPWTVFEFIRLNEEDTTSSSRIFIKIMCQELSEHMGMKKLKQRFLDPIMEQTFSGMFPKDSPRNTRFAINFFTSIGLGGLTTELREYLKNAPTMIMAQAQAAKSSDSSSSSGSDSDSDSDSSSSSGSSSGSSSSSSSDSSDSDSD